VLSAALLADVGRRVIAPALRTLAARGTPFVGALYAGLMVRPARVPGALPEYGVLEFNARLGDPECQVMLARVQGELLPWLDGAARGELPGAAVPVKPGAALGVVLASAGYPEKPRSGDAIAGLEAAEATGARVFHAGTRLDGGALVTAGGRVLTVCGEGETLEAARAQAYAGCQAIRFEGMQLRHDIGARALR
jgi:phosphoribosylamine--glycine ligase